MQQNKINNDEKEMTYGRFYMHPQLQGDGKYKDVIYVEVFIKGNKNTSFSRPKNRDDETLYPNAWRAFMDNSPIQTDGNPLGVMPGLGPSEIMNLNNLGIGSIEDLANLSETVIDEVRRGRELKKRAQAYLAALYEKTEEEHFLGDSPVDEEVLKNDPNVISRGFSTRILEQTAKTIIEALPAFNHADLIKLEDKEMRNKGRIGLLSAIRKELDVRDSLREEMKAL